MSRFWGGQEWSTMLEAGASEAVRLLGGTRRGRSRWLCLLSVCLLSVLLGGCGGPSFSSGGAPPQFAVAGATPTPSATPLPSPGPNSISGTVSVQGTSSAAPTVTLYQGTTQAGRANLNVGGGSFVFANLAGGSYRVVVSGSGLRTQSDTFNVRNGAVIKTAYTLSALTEAPTGGELAGAFAQNVHLFRAFYNWRGSALATQLQLDFNRRNNFVSGSSTRAVPTQSQVVSIPLAGAQSIAVDRTGMAWVSVNDSIGGTQGAAGVAQINTQGQVVGQFASARTANSGGGVIGVDHALDVAVFNNSLNNLGVFLAGTSSLSAQPTLSGGTVVTQFASQTVPGSSSLTRLVVGGFAAGTSPRLWFLTGGGTLTRATLPSNFPTSFQILGVLCDPSDNTIYVAGNAPTGSQFIHLSEDASTVLDTTSISTFEITGQQSLTVDTSGTFWMTGQGGFLFTVSPINPSTGMRTVNPITAVHADNTPFGMPIVGLAADNAGHVWVADQGNNNVTEFDLTGTPLVTLNVGTQPTSVAVDSENNVWVACNGPSGQPDTASVSEVVVGGAVPPNTVQNTYQLSDGSTVTQTPSPSGSTILQTFLNSTYQNLTDLLPTTGSGPTSTVTLTASYFSGPTAVSQTGSYDSSTQQYTVDSTTVDAMTGMTVQTQTGESFTSSSGSVSAQLPNGLVYQARYTAATDQSGDVLLTATVVDKITEDTLQITATYLPNGAVQNFTVIDEDTGVNVTAQVSNEGEYSAQAFSLAQPGVALATATNLTQSIQNVILSATSTPAGVSGAPGVATQNLTGTLSALPSQQQGTVPGNYDVTVTMDGETSTMSVPVADQGNGDLTTMDDVQNAATDQTVGTAGSSGTMVPANQGGSEAADAAGDADGGYIAGGCSGSGGQDTDPPGKTR